MVWQRHKLSDAGSWSGWLRAGGQWLLNAMVPPRCPLCRAPVLEPHTLCPACWPRLHLIDEPACPASGLPLIGTPQAIAAYKSLPALLERAPWRALLATAFHDDAARELVHRLKYHDDHTTARLMAQLMWRRLRAARPPAHMLIVPVPLHRRRLWARRFNQSAILARHLARLARLPHDPLMLARVRPTAPQTGLSGQARRRNLKDAFAVPPARRTALKGRHVLLVDDVFTTGATARACANTLKKAGAAEVWVAVFALAGSRRALHI